MTRHLTFLLLVAVGISMLGACSKKGPEPISFGSDACANCRMTISDAKFGAELVTKKGRLLKFDSVECLAGFLHQKGKGEEASSLWVIDFAHPSQLIEATKAFYLQSDRRPSPMGLNLSAFSDREAATANQRESQGAILSWSEVLQYVDQRWK